MDHLSSLPPSCNARLPFGMAVGISDVGARQANEDNFLIDEELALLVVADGLGGHDAGALASASAIQALRDFIQRARGNGMPPADEDRTVPADITLRRSRRGADHTRPEPGSQAALTAFDAVTCVLTCALICAFTTTPGSESLPAQRDGRG